MAQVNKTISLDEKTAVIASRMPNFSEWVRNQVLEYARSAKYSGFDRDMEEIGLSHMAPEAARIWGPYGDACNPRHKDGLCPICYAEEGQ